MGNGWIGKIIRVNLTDNTMETEPLNMEDTRLYAGGRGLGTKYCVDSVEPKTDPLGQGNLLAFMTGPLTGTLAPGAGMYSIVSKVPQSGAIGSCSSGGYFGPELKFAGFDGILVEGKAKEPVYLYLDGDHMELRNAGHLWGRNVPAAVDEIIKGTSDDVKIACIGPSGERLDLSSAIVNDKHRTSDSLGFGAVMGSKNLKAIAVRGTKSIRAAKNQEFLNTCLKARNIIKTHSYADGAWPTSGTTSPADIPDRWRAYLAGSWKRSCLDKVDNVCGEIFSARRSAGNGGCFGCFTGCGRTVKIERPRFTGFGQNLKEETDWSFGPREITGDAAELNRFRNFMAVVESLGICPSTTAVIGLHDIAEMFRACTGFSGTDDEILKIGERILRLETDFNRKQGLSK